MFRLISLFLVLMATWLLLSGHYTPLLISFGIGSCLLSALIAYRMDVVDRESQPFYLGPRIIAYWGWLLVEIYTANIDVAKCVLFPRKYLKPSIFVVKATQQTDLGKVIFANSITLTPGTVTIDIDEDNVMVHSLTEVAAEGIKSGEMDRRVTRVMEES